MAKRRHLNKAISAQGLAVQSVPVSAHAAPMPQAPEPSEATVFIVGTPHAGWKALADAMWQGLSVGDARLHGGVRTGAGPALEDMAAAHPETRFIVLVESPARALAHWIAQRGAGTAESALAEWCEGARRLIAQAHRWPTRCLFMDSAEAAANPAALARTLSGWDSALPGWAVQSPAADWAVPNTDPLCLLLAYQAALADQTAGRLFEELHARCVVLADKEGPTAADPVAALHRYRDLAASSQRLELALAESLAIAGQARRTADLQVSALREERDGAREELESVLAQQRRVQLELEAAHRQHHEAEQRGRGAVALQRQQPAEPLRHQIAAASDCERGPQDTADTLAREQRDAQASVQQAGPAEETRAAALKAELDESRQESEVLLLQLYQVQEELEALLVHRQEAQEQLQRQSAEHGEREQVLQGLIDTLTRQLRDAQGAMQQAEAADSQAQQAASRRADAMQAEIDILRGELLRHEGSANRLRADAEATGAELQGLREVLAKEGQAREATQARTSALQTELEARRRELDQHRSGLAAARTDAEAARTELERLRESLANEAHARHGAETRATALQAEREDSRQEGELLLLQLHQVQEELEGQFLQLEDLQLTLSTIDAGPGAPARASRIGLSHGVEERPHRHLHFELRQLRVGERHLPALEVRLVEHHGRPGLVLFAGDDEARALSAWHTSGQEDGRDYLLLVPADTPSIERLQELGSADWLLVHGLARLLRQHLATAAEGVPAHWRTVAARLCRQLDDLPARLRYDTLAVAAEVPSGDTLRLEFGRPLFGEHAMGSLRLTWQVPGNSLYWLAPEPADAVPMAQWPVDGDGMLQPVLRLPIGTALDSAQKRQQWAEMPASDQALLLGVLDALTAAAAQAPDAALPAGMTRDALAAAAADLQKDAQRTLTSLRARSVARRLLRGARVA